LEQEETEGTEFACGSSGFASAICN
jgi:hypothetical protein